DNEVILEKVDNYVIGYRGERKRIMLVDDNVVNASMLVSLLEPLGFAIDTASNGQEALLLAEKHRPDLVLMDLIMPVMNGLETATILRKNRVLTETKIIGASATVTDNAYKEAFVAVCDEFVTKPIRIDHLLEKIGGLLGIVWEVVPIETENGRSLVNSEQLFVVPSAEAIERLYELAMMGNMQEIEKWANDLEAGNQIYSCFAVRLRELAGGFKTKAILALVEQYRGEGK
ncbi:MAG: response regulator, partial [Desulfobulbaceae bacterium]|nr:response regulator [Desulfobulbaceae bacterium]